MTKAKPELASPLLNNHTNGRTLNHDRFNPLSASGENISLAQPMQYVPQTYVSVLLKYDSFLCAVISKTILKALECNKMTLTVFVKDLLISEKNVLICAFSLLPLHQTRHTCAYVKNDGTGEWQLKGYRTSASLEGGLSMVLEFELMTLRLRARNRNHLATVVTSLC
ncbi:hypothetical protein TNCV_1002721 [Trichonephila clavipes]|nr:hypothetical protein TNCV_1002721 [Trichonephila clavipes]